MSEDLETQSYDGYICPYCLEKKEHYPEYDEFDSDLTQCYYCDEWFVATAVHTTSYKARKRGVVR